MWKLFYSGYHYWFAWNHINIYDDDINNNNNNGNIIFDNNNDNLKKKTYTLVRTLNEVKIKNL